VVGYSLVVGGTSYVATEWSNGQVFSLPSLPGFTFAGLALGINNAGQAVGLDQDAPGHGVATEWSNGQVINLGGPPGSTSNSAVSINNAGQVAGYSFASNDNATEWSNGQVFNLGPLWANDINEAGQVVGYNGSVATEWSNGQTINLPLLPGSIDSQAEGINNAGQVVGYSTLGYGNVATEWSNGQLAPLPLLPGFKFESSVATGINDAGEVVGYSVVVANPGVPEPSTWALMLLGFAGLGYAGYRQAKRASFQPV
jgi:probable HAF family extracellular repeat protein